MAIQLGQVLRLSDSMSKLVERLNLLVLVVNDFEIWQLVN